MYVVNENRLDWVLLKKDNMLLSEYSDKVNNILTYGAGSWEMQNDNLLSFRIYVDDEVNLPNSFVKKIRVNSVVNSFNDIIKASSGGGTKTKFESTALVDIIKFPELSNR